MEGRQLIHKMQRKPQVVAWGGRGHDIQVGSREDRTHMLYLNMLAAHLRASRAVSDVVRQVGVAAQDFAERVRDMNLALERSVPSAAEQIEQAARSAGLLRGARNGRTDT